MSLGQLCDELDHNARVWFEYYRPSTEQAVVSVYLILFAEVADSQLPVVAVQQLQLTAPADWWPPS